MTLQEFLIEWNNPDERVLVHTSGSTGTPKPMWVEKCKMLNSARITCDFLNLQSRDTALLCMPLDYIAGKMVVVRSLERGLKLIQVEPSNHPLAGLDGEKLVFAAMVPSQVFCSLQVPEEREALKHIRHLIIGGGAISAELQTAIRDLHSEGFIWSTYGMTETLSHIALRRLNGSSSSEWYVPFDSVRVALNQDGCLMIDAPLVHDGMLVTNDLAEIKDGKFRILGRRDNVICSGGIKLQIEQIEAKLQSYLHVPFCITRRKDAKFGEVVVLLVSGEDVSEEKLHEAFLHLNRYEVPKVIIKVPAIPRTETGKISRAEAEKLAR